MNMHEQVAEMLPAYALGDLPEPQAAEVQAHLADCAECRVALSRIAAVLSHADHARDLTVNPVIASAASERLLASVRSQSSGGPGSHVSLRRSTPWSSLKEIRIMQSRRRRFAAAFAAAIVVAAGILAVFHAMLGGQKAWAIEQTIEALQQVRLVHITGSFRLTDGEGSDPGRSGTFECWATPDAEEPGSKDMKAVMASEGHQLVGLSRDGQALMYSSSTNTVRYLGRDTVRMDVLPGPRFMENLKKHLSQMSVSYGDDERTSRPCVFLTAASAEWGRSWWIQLDQETKLPVRIKEWANLRREGPPRIDGQLSYSTSVPAGLFDFQVPDGAQVIHEDSASHAGPSARPGSQ